MNNNKILNPRSINISEFDKGVLNTLKTKFNNALIYYKPSINGDIPDILILEENKGVILIDISTLKLSEYKIKDQNTFISQKTQEEILSPIKKLSNIKNHLFKSHIDSLLEQKVKSGGKAFSIIKNVVKEDILSYAVEIRGHKIVQALGKDNKPINAEDSKKIDMWFKDVYLNSWIQSSKSIVP